LYADGRFTVLNLVEEILPFTDWIPTASLAWIAEFVRLIQERKARAQRE
jgi:hypothetical protein